MTFIDRKSTRLNSSHLVISYAVFCLKKKSLHELKFIVDLIHEAGMSRMRALISDKAKFCELTFSSRIIFIFFFNDTPTTEIYTLSLHDALPILRRLQRGVQRPAVRDQGDVGTRPAEDRKSTRLNSSHLVISYAVFCLKKKK